MTPPIFLGGACGRTTWRTDIAIPILEAAGIPYFNPQLQEGEWTPAHQYAEMTVKEMADVWLFILTGDTRGIASIGEVAYRIGQRGKIALAIEEVPYDAIFEERMLLPAEVDDLNRGRVFLKAMARNHGIPVFSDIDAATRHAVELAKKAENELSIARLKAILDNVHVTGFHFACEKIADHFIVQIQQTVEDALTGQTLSMHGRQWIIEPDASESEVVRTLLKATLTWEEHEIRERFHYNGNRIFHPHFQLINTPHGIPHT